MVMLDESMKYLRIDNESPKARVEWLEKFEMTVYMDDDGVIAYDEWDDGSWSVDEVHGGGCAADRDSLGRAFSCGDGPCKRDVASNISSARGPGCGSRDQGCSRRKYGGSR